jgi:hypothetical protein
MTRQEEQARHTPQNNRGEGGDETPRADEQGDVAEPDAPTRVEENSGMNTILDGGSGTGVQEDESDE